MQSTTVRKGDTMVIEGTLATVVGLQGESATVRWETGEVTTVDRAVLADREVRRVTYYTGPMTVSLR